MARLLETEPAANSSRPRLGEKRQFPNRTKLVVLWCLSHQQNGNPHIRRVVSKEYGKTLQSSEKGESQTTQTNVDMTQRSDSNGLKIAGSFILSYATKLLLRVATLV